tara:strand:+ start:2598 stop:2810 length:213 start_codon:yes stop_codon:yes gene_type:complete
MDGLQQIKSTRGLASRLARELGISPARISEWTRIPAERLPDVERITGIPRHELRPDICPPPGSNMENSDG